MAERGWGRLFESPIEVAGRKLVTLRDAGRYITSLPKKGVERLRTLGAKALVAPNLDGGRSAPRSRHGHALGKRSAKGP